MAGRERSGRGWMMIVCAEGQVKLQRASRRTVMEGEKSLYKLPRGRE